MIVVKSKGIVSYRIYFIVFALPIILYVKLSVMKKQYIHFLLCAVLLTACKAQNKKTSTTLDKDIKEFVKSVPGVNAGTGTFSIEATDGWTKVDTSINGLQIVLLKSEMEGSDDVFMENINVVTEKADGMDADEYFKANLASLSNGMPGYQKLSSDNVTINGLEARHLTYTHTYTGSPAEVEAYFFAKGGLGYVITCSTEKGKLPKWKSSFDKVVNTFKIN